MLGLELDHVRKLHLRLFAIELRRRLTGRGLHRRRFDTGTQLLYVGIETVEGLSGIAPVNIAKSHDILRRQVDKIRSPHAADADAGNVQLVARRNKPAPKNVARNDGHSCRRSGLRKKFSARNRVICAHGSAPRSIAAKRVPRAAAGLQRQIWQRPLYSQIVLFCFSY